MDIYPFNSVTNCETYKGDFSRQLHRNKCPFNSITSYGRVWKKGAESIRLTWANSAGKYTEISKYPFNSITSYGSLEEGC